MREVEVKIRFVTPSLANLRCTDYDRFQRDAGHNVIFMSTWWKSIFEYGAQALGRHMETVREIKVHPVIDGVPKRYKRYYGDGLYKEHEAFIVDDVIGIKVMLPDSIPYSDFLKILSLAGPYRGISPYKWSDGYGNFIPVSDPDEYR